MKIKKIEVKKLFGIFNHDIPLSADEHITIIHGPNGYGKTLLLTLLNGIFNSQYFRLRSIPFAELTIYFNDQSRLSLKKHIDGGKEKKNPNGNHLQFEYSRPGKKTEVHCIEPLDIDKIDFPLHHIIHGIGEFERISPNRWRHEPTQEVFSSEDILEQYSHLLPYPVLEMKSKTEPNWLKTVKKSISINFIETQRLLYIRDLESASKIMQRTIDFINKSSSMDWSVKKFSDELMRAIHMKLSEYGSLSQKLDRTFPTRLVKSKKSKGATIDSLNAELKKLEEKRSRLIAAGLLDKEKELDFKDLQKIDESKVHVLSLYIKDVKEKLSVFDELTDKIDLMVKIINSRFLHKRLSISKEEGFVFTTSGGRVIPAVSLSSGEQHELVLLYEMLFKVEPNSLILIDEPELSLHVAWQQQFLRDLQEITRLAGFDVLIATHSPQIINDRWDLTVELKGPDQ